MNKFEARNVASETGWNGWGMNDKFRRKVPEGELIVHIQIGYELSYDNSSDDEVSLVLEIHKPSSAHPPVASRRCCLRYMDESRFKQWLESESNELLEIGQNQSRRGELP